MTRTVNLSKLILLSATLGSPDDYKVYQIKYSLLRVSPCLEWNIRRPYLPMFSQRGLAVFLHQTSFVYLALRAHEEDSNTPLYHQHSFNV